MTLSYPLNLNEFDNDFVTFQHRPYRTNSEYGYQGSAPAGAGAEAIKLYMPNSTPAASQGNTWSENSFGSGLIGKGIERVVSDGVGVLDGFNRGDSAGEIGKNFGKSITSNIASIINQGGALAYEAAIKASASATDFKGDNILSFTTGQIFNPNVELLYQGPQLRSFRFDFVFVPKNAPESNQVDQIIKTFKEYSSPDDSEKGYLQVPHVWDIKYGGTGGKKMNKFKPCALTDITVQDNAGSETHTTFVDGTPVITSMSLQFREMDMVFRKDHAQGVRGF